VAVLYETDKNSILLSMTKNILNLKKWSLLLVLLAPLMSCSHKYSSDILDLSFYQWNQWPDTDADWNEGPALDQSDDLSNISSSPPTCGWEVLHRGNGNLVRIPAVLKDHVGVSWYHCRFTLPEIWKDRRIVLKFEAAGPEVEVYLNEALLCYFRERDTPFELDVTDQIYYVRDNHLAIRITDPSGGGGIGGNITVNSSEKTDQ
jgi:hypothetical protein